VLDTAGDTHVVSFSRPVDKYIWVGVSVDSLNAEETLPVNATLAIKNAIIAYAAANIGNGSDVILQRLEGPIYAAVSGIAHLTITAGATNDTVGPPSYSASNISIGKAANAVFDISRISVTGV